MNHYYCHCLDYNESECPKTCFRAKLTKEYNERCIDFVGIPVTWANLRNNTLCPLNKPKHTNADRIRAMTDEELAKKISGIEQFALTVDGAWSPEQWLDWLKQEVQE